MYFDRSSLSGTQSNLGEFSVSFDTNSNSIPDGELFRFYIEDRPKTSKFMTGTGVLSSSGTVFTIKKIASSSAGYGEMVSFTGNVSIAAAPTSDDLNNMSRGKGLVFLLGQSNIIGLNTGADARDFAYDKNLTWDRDIGTNGAIVQITEPLNHRFFQIVRTQPCLSYATPFGNKLIDTGYNGVLNVPCGADSSSFDSGQWVPATPGNTYYNYAVTDSSNALSENDEDYPLCILLRIGESDFIAGTTQTQMRDYIVDMITQFRTDVQTNTGKDMSKCPAILIGLNQDYLTNNAGAINIENGIADAVDYLPYSSYQSMQIWSSSTDDTHDDLDTIREMGNNRLPNTLVEAWANRYPSALGFQSTATATATAISILRSTANPLNSSVTGTATATGSLDPFTVLNSSATGTATGTSNLTDAAVGAPSPSFLLQKGVEQTPASGAADSWGSTVDTKQLENLTGSFKGTFTSGYLDLNGTSIYNFNPGLGSAILNDAAGCTIIFDVEANGAPLANDNILIGTGHRLTAQGDFAEIQGTATTWSGLTANTRQWVAMTIDRGQDFMKVFLDDTEDAVVNGIAALESTGDATGDQQIGGTVGAYVGRIYNVYIVNQPMTLEQCQDAVATYFIT